MSTESTSLSSSSPLLNPPSLGRSESTGDSPFLAPPTPVRGMDPVEAAVNVLVRDVIPNTDSLSNELHSPSSNVTEANRGTSSVWATLGSLFKSVFGGTSSSSAVASATGATTGNPRHSLVRPSSSASSEPSLAGASTRTSSEIRVSEEAEHEVQVEAEPEVQVEAEHEVEVEAEPEVEVEAEPPAIEAEVPPGAGASAVPTLAEIQARAIALNTQGTMPGSLLHQVKGNMTTMYGNATISSKMARDANDKYDLDTWDNRGIRCYKMDVTFVISSNDAGPSATVHEVRVTKTIYTNAVDPKQALQIIDAIKKGVVDSANGTDATLQNESTFLLDFDKDIKTGQFTGLKSIKGQTTNIDLTLPTSAAARYTAVKGKKIKAGEHHAGEVTYQSKSEMLQKGASYAIRGTGGRDVIMNRIGANNLTVETFVKDIEKKEKELEETRKKSFMRFNGIFGDRESSDVGTFKAYSEAFEAVSAATPTIPTNPKTEVVLRPEWASIPKVKAYIEAHNTVVAKEAERTTQTARVETLAAQTRTLSEQRTTARQALTDHQNTYDEAKRANEEAERALFEAQTALARIPGSNIIGEVSPERTEASRLVEQRRNLSRTAHSNFARIDTDHTRLENEVMTCDRNLQARVAEYRRENNVLRGLRDVTSAQRKFDKMQRKFDNLSEKMSKQLAAFRREYDELAELKRTVDGMVADPVTRGTDRLSDEDLAKLQETQARLAAIETYNRDLLEHLGLRATVPTPPTQPIIASFTPPTP